MSDELNELYQEIILDHHRRPRNRGQLPVPPATLGEGYNPLCGDQLSVFVNLDHGKISDIKFTGEGCAISQSSASLMTQHVKGKTVPEARAEIAAIQNLLTGDTEPPIAVEERLGDIIALKGVRKFVARVKCATLAWHALDAALAGHGPISTE
ncbi:MAG: Fe-S cluster assembly sulfur transfer protein SufU [Opitutales bacterium]|jgi:nitrogen fixation NifU-like protein